MNKRDWMWAGGLLAVVVVFATVWGVALRPPPPPPEQTIAEIVAEYHADSAKRMAEWNEFYRKTMAELDNDARRRELGIPLRPERQRELDRRMEEHQERMNDMYVEQSLRRKPIP